MIRSRGLAFAFLVTALFIAHSAHAWTLESVEGDVTVESARLQIHPAIEGATVAPGETVRVGAHSHARLTDDGPSELVLAENSSFYYAARSIGATPGLLRLLRGQMRANVKRPPGSERYPYEFRLRTVVAGVRGTEFLLIDDGKSESVETLEGKVHIYDAGNPRKFWEVGPGRGVSKLRTQAPVERPSDPNLIRMATAATTFASKKKPGRAAAPGSSNSRESSKERAPKARRHK